MANIAFRYIIFIFYTNSSSDELDKAIDGVHYTQGLTFTHLALEEVLKHGFTAQAGARDDVPRIVVIVTDGWSRDPTNTLINAQKAKDAGIIMFSIGNNTFLHCFLLFFFILLNILKPRNVKMIKSRYQ